MGYFSYNIDLETGICFHSQKKSPACYLNFSESQKFSHQELSIRFHAKDQTIQIQDPNHDIEIYIQPSLPIDNE